MTNSVFRAYRYSADHPALAGRDLTPENTITGKPPDYLTPDGVNSVLSDSNPPTNSLLQQNYPNPCNARTVIPYRLQAPCEVRLEICNLLGQQVITLVQARQTPGVYQIIWDGCDALCRAIHSGIYLYQLQLGDKTETRKMTVMR